MKGNRAYPDSEGHLYLKPGEYGKDLDGMWWVRPPIEGLHAGTLDEHIVTEHGDGTITVTPSILLPGTYHGFLERGVWRDAS